VLKVRGRGQTTEGVEVRGKVDRAEILVMQVVKQFAKLTRESSDGAANERAP